MKKIISVILIIVIVFILGSCGEKSQGDIVKSLGEKMEKIDKFEVDAVMEIKEMNKSHLFDVNIKYKEPSFFKVTLKNRDSNNVQIVLKNEKGVFVLTPALNKSFKFQSDWPLNSSQPYLFQSLVKDIINDENVVVAEQNGDYVFETKVKYRRSSELTSQKIVIDGKTLFPKEVIVFDSSNNEKINVLFEDVNYKPKFNEDEFKVDYSMNQAISTYKDDLPTFDERTIMYPTGLIDGTTLKQETVKEIITGKRAIMTFEGTAPFTVVEEYLTTDEELGASEIIYGDPVLICSGIAFQTDTTLLWHDNGIEFLIISEHLDPDQMYSVANSFMADAKK
ncbi:outer membrane lipoprotein carrier protein LolA [Mycoplasmatota bacterium]|nr:outer membrane lipoprotein carrier protein LolA [Mycoplasmatota bacterium]